jgi:hypothetical protein
MRASFFKGWRRKVGCASLVIAVGISVMWFRSYVIAEQLHIPRPNQVWLASNNGAVHWRRLSPAPDFADHAMSWSRVEIDRSGINESRRWFQHFWSWGGFSYRAGPFHGYTIEQWHELVSVPYWSLVLPLVVLTSALFIWKPRPRERRSATVETKPTTHA